MVILPKLREIEFFIKISTWRFQLFLTVLGPSPRETAHQAAFLQIGRFTLQFCWGVGGAEALCVIGLLGRGQRERGENSAGNESVEDGYGNSVVLRRRQASIEVSILTHTHRSVFGLLKISGCCAYFLSPFYAFSYTTFSYIYIIALLRSFDPLVDY